MSELGAETLVLEQQNFYDRLGRLSCLLWMGSLPFLAFFRGVSPVSAVYLDVPKLFAIVALLRWSFLGVCSVRILNLILYLPFFFSATPCPSFFSL